MTSLNTDRLGRALASAALGCVGVALIACSASGASPSVLAFERATVPVGESLRLDLTVDPALVGQDLVLWSGTTLGPTRIGGLAVSIGGAVRARASMSADAPATSVDFTVPGSLAGKTIVLLFTTEAGGAATSASNVVNVSFSSRDATLKDVPVSPGYGWIQGDSGTLEPFQSVSFIDDFRGYAAGLDSTVWKTVDGGRTWDPQLIDTGVSAAIQSVDFVDSQRGWAIGNFFIGYCWYTTDGGSSWTRRSVNIGALAADFVDASHGWIVGLPGAFGGSSSIAHTDDGGVTWRMQAQDVDAELRAVRFIDSQRGLAVGRDGVVLFTSDGGAVWRRSALPAPYDAAFLMACELLPDGLTAYVCGFDSVVLRTRDAGDTWEPLPVRRGRDYLSVDFTRASEGWLAGDRGTILWTFDGGDTWLPFDTAGGSVPGDPAPRFNDLRALDPNSAWVVGYEGDVRRFSRLP